MVLARAQRRLRTSVGRLIRRLGLVPAGQPDGLGEDAALGGVRFSETVLAVYPDAPSNLYQLRLWLRTLEQLSLPTAVVVQDSRVAAALRRETPLRVYALGRYSTFEALVDGSAARLALYPAHHTRNFQIMRRADLAHVYLGHGESDKAVSASNQLKAYDFTFASGPSAVDRAAVLPFYDATERMIVVGRPQLAGLFCGSLPAGATTTVLYAPTWEGDQSSMHYGSVATLGAPLVTALLAAGHRVVYRPHPRSGLSDSTFAVADQAVRELVRSAAESAPERGHRVSTGGEVIEEFNTADLLVTDLSSLVVDWLPTGRPLLVTRLPGALEQDSPVLAAVPRLEPGDDPTAVVGRVLADGVDDAVRADLVRYYLGGVDDPQAAFESACVEVIARHAEARAEMIDRAR